MDALVLYVPVVHRGYVNLLAKHPEAGVFVLGQSLQRRPRNFRNGEVFTFEPGLPPLGVRAIALISDAPLSFGEGPPVARWTPVIAHDGDNLSAELQDRWLTNTRR